jgi:hypothetical protein
MVTVDTGKMELLGIGYKHRSLDDIRFDTVLWYKHRSLDAIRFDTEVWQDNRNWNAWKTYVKRVILLTF